METIRAYAGIRNRFGEIGRRYLSELKLGTFVFYKGFDKSASGFADLGTYGSTILGDFNNKNNLLYVVERIPHNELISYIGGKPSRYSSIIKPQKVSFD